MASRQDYFTLLSHDTQIHGTEEEVLNGEPPRHLQAQRGFLKKQSEWGSKLLRYSCGRPTNKKSVNNSLDMAAAYITFECSFVFIDIRLTST